MKHVHQLFQHKYAKYAALALALILIFGLARCSRKEEAPAEENLYRVVQDGLEVHKKAKENSKVRGELPAGLEIEILDQKTTKKAVWGQIDKIVLPDGTKIKGGWIDLQYVKSASEPEIEPTEPPTEPEPTEPPAPSVEATMGTITTGKLHIRKGAGTKYDAIDSYVKGDRIEILETTMVDDTQWARTNIGWIGMGYVKMDGTGTVDTYIVSANKSMTILGYGVVNLGSLNVRSGPGTGHDKVAEVTARNRYAYYERTDGWVRIEGGWVSEEYFYIEGTQTADAFNGSVNTDNLKLRTGPATSFKNIGSFKVGDPVKVLATVDGWAYVGNGWVNQSYITPTYTTGVVTITSGLNIRKEANSSSESMGTYKAGDIVTILEVKDGWGKTEKGWISLKYVKYN